MVPLAIDLFSTEKRRETINGLIIEFQIKTSCDKILEVGLF